VDIIPGKNPQGFRMGSFPSGEMGPSGVGTLYSFCFFLYDIWQNGSLFLTLSAPDVCV
jgi:hypothetical protein